MARAVDRDKFGHCVKCHKYMLREVIDRGKVVVVPTADSDHEKFFLNDGSNMRVSMCRKCKQELTEDDFDYVIDAVINGWEWETTQLVNDPKKELWDKEKKDKYMKRYSKLKIIGKTKHMSKSEKNKKEKAGVE